MKNRILIMGLCLAATAGGYSVSRAFVEPAPQTVAIRPDLSSYREIVKTVLPGVVTIEARSKTQVSRNRQSAKVPFGSFPGLPDELRKEFERFNSQPFDMPETPRGHAFGSGFIVDPSGVILTNDHVIRGADEVQVVLHDGRKFTSRVIKRDPRTDLAVVRIEAGQSLPYLKLGNSDAMEVGDRVLAVGAPLGMTGTVTSGIISAKGRDIHLNMYEDFLQTDAAINPGNSGGPLVNLAGEVVGINSAIKSGTGGFQGIGLAISSNLVKNVLDQLQHNGSVVRGYLGVGIQALDSDVASRLGMKDKRGVVITKVMEGSPAAKAGLQDGDILTELAGQAVAEPRTLQRVVSTLPIGKQVEAKVVRDGDQKTITLTVQSQPESFGLAADSQERTTPEKTGVQIGKLGVHVSDLTSKEATRFGYAESVHGVVVTDVDADSPAGLAGIEAGMLILKVDRQQVKSVAEVERAMENSSLEKGVLLQVRSPRGGTVYVMLKST